MKRKYRTAILIALLLLFTMCATLIRGDTAQQAEFLPAGGFLKDETVYVNLARDGSVEEVNVVNRLETVGRGIYTDHGIYESIVNLTGTSLPDIKDDMISWQLDTNGSGFYYQGRLSGAKLPYVFEISYELNGAKTDPDEMAGKSGDIKISLKVSSDQDALQYFRDTYLCSVQTSIDMEANTDIRAYGSSGIITGRTMTLSYTVLPGKSAVMEITFRTSSFSHEGFTFTCIPFDAGSFGGIDTDEIRSGFRRLGEGAEEIAEGTGRLKAGIGLLSGSTDSLASSSKEIYEGTGEYSENLKKYTSGISSLSDKADSIAANLAEIAAGSSSLYELFLLTEARTELLLAELEQDQDGAHSEDIYVIREMMSAYKEQLVAFSEALVEISSGMASFAAGMSSLDNSGALLADSLSAILSGMEMFTEGLSGTASELGKLPGEIQKLIDAQELLTNGITDAGTSLDGFIPSGSAHETVSFVSDRNTNVRSVQFLYKTKEIWIKEPVVTGPADEIQKKGFFEKLFDLFRK